MQEWGIVVVGKWGTSRRYLDTNLISVRNFTEDGYSIDLGGTPPFAAGCQARTLAHTDLSTLERQCCRGRGCQILPPHGGRCLLAPDRLCTIYIRLAWWTTRGQRAALGCLLHSRRTQRHSLCRGHRCSHTEGCAGGRQQ